MNIAIIDDIETERFRLEQILKQYAVINQLEMNIEQFSGGGAFPRKCGLNSLRSAG